MVQVHTNGHDQAGGGKEFLGRTDETSGGSLIPENNLLMAMLLLSETVANPKAQTLKVTINPTQHIEAARVERIGQVDVLANEGITSGSSAEREYVDFVYGVLQDYIFVPRRTLPTDQVGPLRVEPSTVVKSYKGRYRCTFTFPEIEIPPLSSDFNDVEIDIRVEYSEEFLEGVRAAIGLVRVSVHDAKNAIMVLTMGENTWQKMAGVLQGHGETQYATFARDFAERLRNVAAELYALLDRTSIIDSIEHGIVTFDLVEMLKKRILARDTTQSLGDPKVIFSNSPESLLLSINQSKLRVVIDNLLTNALKYSQGNVFVQLSSAGDKSFTLVISNFGNGLTQEQIADIYAGRAKRSNGEESEGWKAIKQNIDALDGVFTIESKVGGMTTVTVTLPCSVRE